MPKLSKKVGDCTVTGYRGDAKAMLAFDLLSAQARKNLAGFTIHVAPPQGAAYYLWNNLSFETPADHAQVAGEPRYSTVNAPIHKFRWVHVPGLDHQGLAPPFGLYRYTVTPRYFDDHGHLLPLEDALSVSIDVPVEPFTQGRVKLGFTRGFVQSQAFVRHFGPQLPSRPKDGPLDYDTSAQAGIDPRGTPYSYRDQYRWLGFTARDRIFEILEKVKKSATLRLDVFAYDLNEPDIVAALLALAPSGRVRAILDNADLHHDATDPKAEDEFEERFRAVAANADDQIKRGKFGRYAHDKVFVVYDTGVATTVLAGSTNFSVTGMYVNSNHVLVFEDPEVAGLYADVFAEAWADGVSKSKFAHSACANVERTLAETADRPTMSVTFSPHLEPFARTRLGEIVDRCKAETTVPGGKGNIFFAVMELGSKGENPVFETLNALHANANLFSYGVSDNPNGISYYPVGSSTGVLVTGKPVNTQLPPPFNQVPNIGGIGHQIHHKFVVCGFNGPDPVVFCGSSNLALLGEQNNGDNLIAIHDGDVVTAFVIEALLLIDHFNFLDKTAKGPKAKAGATAEGRAAALAPPAADKRAAASGAGWFLGTTDAWAAKYFDPADLHARDRTLFA